MKFVQYSHAVLSHWSLLIQWELIIRFALCKMAIKRRKHIKFLFILFLGDMSSRHFKPEIRVTCLRFSPTGGCF